ncbi:hypothetical protein CKO45_12845 [Paracraurococcus ruber]|uniref:HTH lysR-type domain-containing protein n=1 Tax=Paracraurococcus ruber TaxID=77675 RepID=A0ABS1CY33_9PROT|nr:hypothetical protein [Paracraurococcus ruber]
MRKGPRLRPPPMDTLEAFDAAARLGSFTAAAAVLHRTPGAISRQMAALEGDLGVALFLREARGVALTPAGRRLHAAAAEALALLLGAARELRRHGPGGEGGGTVRISVNPSFGARWLLPRLPRFQAAHPRVAVVPVAETRLVDLAREGFDLAVRYTAGAAPPGLALHPWLREELVPVAAPALLEGRPRTPDALAALPFLHDTSDAFWRRGWRRRGALGLAAGAGRHRRLTAPAVASGGGGQAAASQSVALPSSAAGRAGPMAKRTGRSGAGSVRRVQASSSAASQAGSAPGAGTTKAFSRGSARVASSRTAHSATSGWPRRVSATRAGKTFIPPTCTARSLRPSRRSPPSACQAQRSGKAISAPVAASITLAVSPAAPGRHQGSRRKAASGAVRRAMPAVSELP